MGNILKASIYEVRVENNLFIKNFDDILKEVASRLDDTGNGENIRILDIYKDKETSIWFDSFDYIKDFSHDKTLKNSICFLMAKDMDFSIIEDKEKNELGSYTRNSKIKPKIPSHCIYLPDKKILIIENNTNAATIGTLNRALKEYSENLTFSAKLRSDILKRLNLLLEKIETIDLIDLQLHKYLSIPEDSNAELLSIITNPDSKFKLTLSIDKGDFALKKIVVKLFDKILTTKTERELSDIKIKCKNKKNENEIIKLYDNLVFLSIEKEHYYDDISELDENERINYSKSIYKALIEEFNYLKI